MYYQPNSCNTHTEHEWAGGTFLRQWKKVPPAHAQQVYLEEPIGYKVCPGLFSLSVHLSICLSVCLSVCLEYQNM
jgi:hypothetical protein